MCRRSSVVGPLSSRGVEGDGVGGDVGLLSVAGSRRALGRLLWPPGSTTTVVAPRFLGVDGPLIQITEGCRAARDLPLPLYGRHHSTSPHWPHAQMPAYYPHSAVVQTRRRVFSGWGGALEGNNVGASRHANVRSARTEKFDTLTIDCEVAVRDIFFSSRDGETFGLRLRQRWAWSWSVRGWVRLGSTTVCAVVFSKCKYEMAETTSWIVGLIPVCSVKHYLLRW